MSTVTATTPASQSLADIARGIVAKSQRLQQRFLEALDKLGPKKCWELLKEVSSAIALTKEKVDFAAYVQKEVVDKWSDEEREEMGINLQDVEMDLQYSTVMVPAAEAHMVTERRKAETCRRLVKAWGEDWGEKMGDLMPSWPAAEFLRHLAVYAEKHTWEESLPFFEARIKERIDSLRTKKKEYLMIRDFVSVSVAGKKGKGKAIPGPAPRLAEELPQEIDEVTPAGQVNQIEERNDEVDNQGSIGDQNTQLAQDEPPVEKPSEKAGTSKGPSSSPNTLDSTGHNGSELMGSEVGAAEGSGGTVDDAPQGDNLEEEEEEEAPRPKKKASKRKAPETEPEQPEMKKRRVEIGIPVINLDIEEGIEELKAKAHDDEAKDNALAVEAGLRGLLGGQERIHGTLMAERLRMLMEAAKAIFVTYDD